MNVFKKLAMHQLSRNSLISLLLVGFLGVIILFGIPGAPQDFFQFPRNYIINDNQLNWANHDYGYNLMMSAEPNSIFMTEGGDNQVFSLLYFATTERMRPDIDFFDQKGNVFPRLYGDLLNTNPDELELIRSIRDFQLFSTGRPVYLTWERPNLEKLNINYLRLLKGEMLKKYPPNAQALINSKYRFNNLDELKYTARNMVPNSVYDLTLRSGGNLAEQDFRYLGPWYLKNFGMVFRVTPLRYAIVDALEVFNGRAKYAQIAAEVKALSKIAMIPNQFDFYVNQLVAERYLERDGEDVVMIKPYRASFDHFAPLDLWKHYNYSYTNAPSARYWDFLTREIFGNYVRRYNGSSEHRINTLRRKLSFVADLPTQTAIAAEISELQERQHFFNSTAMTYNYDNPGMVHEQSRIMFNAGDLKGAAEANAITARVNYRFNESYLRAASMLLDYAEKVPAEQDELLTIAKGYLAEFYSDFEKFYVMTSQSGNPNQLPQMQKAKNLEQRINGIANISIDAIKTLEATAGNDIVKLNQLLALYQQRGNYLKAIEVMQKIITVEPTDFNHYLKLVDYAKQNRIDLALSTLDTMIAKHSELNDGKPSIAELQYLRGEVLFSIANIQRSQNASADQVAGLFKMSMEALNSFIAEYQGKPGLTPQLSQQLTRAEAIIARIEEQTKN